MTGAPRSYPKTASITMSRESMFVLFVVCEHKKGKIRGYGGGGGKRDGE